MAEPDKTRRHRLILQILEHTPVASQDELAAELEAHDVSVTQSTLSRDLKELKVMRVPTGDSYRYRPGPPSSSGNGNGGTPSERFRRVAALEVTSIAANEMVVAVHTMSGRAQGVAAYLDALQLPEVLATIAGDDTVMVHPKRTKQTAKLRRRLARLLGLD